MNYATWQELVPDAYAEEAEEALALGLFGVGLVVRLQILDGLVVGAAHTTQEPLQRTHAQSAAVQIPPFLAMHARKPSQTVIEQPNGTST